MSSQLNLANPQSYKLVKELRELAETFKTISANLEDLVGGKVEQISLSLTEKSDELASLEHQLEETKRVKSLDLELAIREDKGKAFRSLAEQLKYAVISEAELQVMKLNLEVFQRNQTEEIETAVKAAKASVYAEKAAAETKLNSDHRVAIAELTAQNSTLKEKVDFLQGQIEALNVQLKIAQESAVRIAEAQKGTIINTSGK